VIVTGSELAGGKKMEMCSVKENPFGDDPFQEFTTALKEGYGAVCLHDPVIYFTGLGDGNHCCRMPGVVPEAYSGIKEGGEAHGGSRVAPLQETQGLLDKAENAMEALGALLDQVKKDWKKLDSCVLGHVLCSPAISLGVSEHCFTEDWGIFQINRAKLGDGFQGNKLDLGAF